MRLNRKSLVLYLEDARAALRFAPVEIAMGIATAITFSVFMRRADPESWMHVGAAAALAFPLVLGLSVLRRRERIRSLHRWIGTAAALLAVAAWSAFVFDPDLESEGWRFVSLFGSSVFALTLVPALGGGDLQRDRFWNFNHLLVVRVAIVVAYTLLLFGALSGALAAVISLFDLTTPEHLFEDLFGWLFFAIAPWMIAGAVPALAEAAENRGAVPVYARLVGRFVFLPVLLLYLTIVLAYVVKIVLTGEMPKNLLSPLVLAAGAFGFLLSPLLQPLADHEEGSGVARLIRFFPLLLIPAIPPAVWAIWVRREQYGWTEFRYLRMALLIAIGALAIYGIVKLLRKKGPVMLEIPIILGGVLALSAIGPWSAQSVSRRNQEYRLQSALEEANLPAGSSMQNIPSELYEKIEGSATYLYNEHGLEALRASVDVPIDSFTSVREFIQALHIAAECDQTTPVVQAQLPPDSAVSVPGGQLYRFNTVFPEIDEGEDRSLRSDTILATRDSLIIERAAPLGMRFQFAGDWTATIDLSDLMESSEVSTQDCDRTAVMRTLLQSESVHPIVDTGGVTRGTVILTEVTGTRRDGETGGAVGRGDGGTWRDFRLTHVSGMVVLTPGGVTVPTGTD